MREKLTGGEGFPFVLDSVQTWTFKDCELKAGTEQSRLPEDDLQFLKNFLQLMNLQMATSVLGINRE